MSATNTLKELYIALKKAEQRVVELESGQKDVLAVIGVGCRFPGGANDPEAYWQLLAEGRNGIGEVPETRWSAASVWDANPEAPGKTYTNRGGFLNGTISDFDAEFFQLTPREAKALDPQQRLLLEVTYEAVEDAGLTPDQLRGSRTGVYVGISADEYARAHRHGRDLAAIDAYSITGTTFSTAAGRVAYFFDLKGPTLALDTACSSSLVALHLAARALRAREADLALVAGVNLMLLPELHICFSKLKALAPDGHCKTFDAAADGYARAEGCGVVVLRRFKDAESRGERIRAVIKGTAVNQDGKSNGLTAPNGEAQVAVLRAALHDAAVNPRDVQYIECHGTGTALGDPIEVESLGRVYGQDRPAPLWLGSAKSNVGHLEPAAGVAGLIKVILSLEKEQLPPNLHFKTLNPKIETNFPLQVVDQALPWPRGERPRLAALSSFGFSGTNAHVVIGEGPLVAKREGTPGEQLVTVSARDKGALGALAKRYAEFLRVHPEALADLAHTARVGRGHGPWRLTAVAADSASMATALDKAAAQEPAQVGMPPRVAMLCTGQGSQALGMGAELYRELPVFREALDACEAIAAPLLGRSLLGCFLDPAATEDELARTRFTQPALFSIAYGLFQVWRSLGVHPTLLIGHSVGEYAAACLAGVFGLEDGLRLIIARGRLMDALPEGGAMLAVKAKHAEVVARLKAFGGLDLAACNGPSNTVVSGPRQLLEPFAEALAADGIGMEWLKVSHAFHSSLMEPMLAPFGEVLKTVQFSAPKITLVSNLTGKVVGSEIQTVTYWLDHTRAAVAFEQGMATVLEHGCDVFLELGPKPVLCAMARACLGAKHQGRNLAYLPSLRPKHGDRRTILSSLGSMYEAGGSMDGAPLQAWLGGNLASIPTYAFQRQTHWMDLRPIRLGGSQEPVAVATGHGLLGTCQKSPASKNQWYSKQVSLDTLPFLEDHQIFGLVVVAGAHHLASLLCGAIEVLGPNGCLLEDVVFPQALVLGEQPVTVQLVLEPCAGGWEARVLSFMAEGAEQFRVHAKAIIRPLDGELASVWHRPGIVAKPEASTPLDASALYQTRLGASYRWIQTAYRGNEGVWAHLAPPTGLRSVADLQVHPGLIDACFGMLVAAAAEDEMVPVRIDEVRYTHLAASQQALLGWARLRGLCPTPGRVVGDVVLCSDKGGLILEFRGLEGRRASAEAILSTGDQAVEESHQLQWRSVATPLKPALTGAWLVFGRDEAFCRHWAQQLNLLGAKSQLAFVGPNAVDGGLFVGSGSKQECLAGLGRVGQALQGVVFVGSTPSGPEDLALCLHLVQALGDSHGQTALSFWLLSVGGASLPGDVSLEDPYQAGLWTLGKVIAQEYPLWKPTRLDLDPSDPVAAAVAHEFGATDGPERVWRQGQRWVPRLIPLSLPVEPVRRIRPDGTYVITGGSGALARHLAFWLSQQGAGSVLLLGRRVEAPAWASMLGPTVLYCSVDVTQFEALRLVLETQQNQLPIRGIFHAAGVLDDGLLRDQTAERFAASLAPKFQGALHLHKLSTLLGWELDFFTGFSSLVSLFGVAGQGPYAVANGCLDALMVRRAQAGLPAQTLHWGPWLGAGMAGSLAEKDLRRMASLGFHGISPQKGVSLLAQAMNAAQAQIGLFPVTWSQFLQQLPQFADLLDRGVASERVEGPSWTEQLVELSPERARATLEKLIQTEVSEVIGLAQGQRIGLRDRLFELGLDSLMALELKNRFERQMARPLVQTLAFDYPTVEALATYLVGLLDLAEIAPVSADENVSSDMDDLASLSEEALAELLQRELSGIQEDRSGTY